MPVHMTFHLPSRALVCPGRVFECTTSHSAKLERCPFNQVLSVAMEQVTYTKRGCRCLTIWRCGFQALPKAFSCLTHLQSLDIMDPYCDLYVLQQMTALTWLKVVVCGRYDPDQDLAFAFPASLKFLEIECNTKHHAHNGRRLDQVYAISRQNLELMLFNLYTSHVPSSHPFTWVTCPASMSAHAQLLRYACTST